MPRGDAARPDQPVQASEAAGRGDETCQQPPSSHTRVEQPYLFEPVEGLVVAQGLRGAVGDVLDERPDALPDGGDAIVGMFSERLDVRPPIVDLGLGDVEGAPEPVTDDARPEGDLVLVVVKLTRWRPTGRL